MELIETKKVTTHDIDQLQKIGRQTFYETFSSANSEENMNQYLKDGFSTEKPLLYEICSKGLVKGSTLLNDTTNVQGWDNVHWWGCRGEGNPIISAPGASHAAHLHWRWGLSAQTYGKQFQSGNPALRELIKTNQAGNFIGGALVDSKIWIQTIKFSVVINSAQFKVDETNLKKLSTEVFDDLYINKNLESIEKGNDIVLFYSMEAFKNKVIPKNDRGPKYSITEGKTLKSGISGNYFIQGLFFGHEPERKIKEAGSTKAEYINPDKNGVKKEWQRLPNNK